jgi:hypothetical protein
MLQGLDASYGAAVFVGYHSSVKLPSSRSTEYTANDWPDSMKVLLVQLLLALEVSGGKGIYQ